MRKIAIFLLFIIGGGYGFSQQNIFFQEAKEKFDKYEEEFKQEFKTRYAFLSDEQKYLVENQYIKILSSIDEARNKAYIEALIKTKVAYDLERISNKNNVQKGKIPNNKRKSEDIPAEYPTGINGLRNEVAELFYTEAINSDEGILATTTTFMVEVDGSITNVKAEGEHIGFNRQAEIAIYLLSHRFKPATRNGVPARSIYRFPMKMRFE